MGGKVKMKKFSMLGLVLISTLILGACGSGTNNTNKTKKLQVLLPQQLKQKLKKIKGLIKIEH